MATTKVADLLVLVRRALEAGGLPADVAQEVAVEFLAAELAGTRTHGVGKVISLNFGDTSSASTIESFGSLVVANGNGANGFVVLRQLAGAVASAVEQTGLGVGFVRNFSRYSSLYPYTELLARKGYVAFLMNAAGPAAVAPYGSIDPVTGTNPIAFSFPIEGGVQTIDFATSDVVWGAIRQAALDGAELPKGPFLDVDGNEVVVPEQVNAVRAFGGAKGSALNIAIELLTSGVVGADLGGEVETEFDLGALLFAVDPNRVGGNTFGDNATRLLAEIRGGRPENSSSSVRVPGDRVRGAAVLDGREQETLEVPKDVLEGLNALARGEQISGLSSNPLFN